MFQQGVEHVTRKRIAGQVQASQSNAELKEDLGTEDHCNYREIVSMIPSMKTNEDDSGGFNLPGFWRIVAHRTILDYAHSQMRLGGQYLNILLALAWCTPQLRPISTVLVCALMSRELARLERCVYE